MSGNRAAIKVYQEFLIEHDYLKVVIYHWKLLGIEFRDAEWLIVQVNSVISNWQHLLTFREINKT